MTANKIGKVKKERTWILGRVDRHGWREGSNKGSVCKLGFREKERCEGKRESQVVDGEETGQYGMVGRKEGILIKSTTERHAK